MCTRSLDLPELAHLGGTQALTTTPIVGTPAQPTALQITSLAHAIPAQMGKILGLAQPRMGALWHLDVSPGVDVAIEELGAHDDGAVTVTQDLTVFNVTEDAVTARRATVNDAAPPVHGPSKTSPELDPPVPPPAWWPEALLDV
jgi:ribonuclease Z